MEEILHVFSDNIALLYEETILTFTMIMGAAFISLVAGILSSKILSVMGESEVLPLRFLAAIPRSIILFLGGYPLVILCIVMLPVTRSVVGTNLGSEAGQFLMTFAGVFFFSALMLRSYSKVEDDEFLAIKTVKNIRILMIFLLSASGIVGFMGMGGLGEVMLRYGYVKNDISMNLIVGGIYALFVIAIEIILSTVQAILRAKLAPLGEARAASEKKVKAAVKANAKNSANKVAPQGTQFHPDNPNQGQFTNHRTNTNNPKDMLDSLINKR